LRNQSSRWIGHTRAMVNLWIPEIIRERPSKPIVLRWVVVAGHEPRDPEATVPRAIRRAGAQLEDSSPGRWRVVIPWRTAVYGFVRRDVDEFATMELLQTPDGWELGLKCLPLEMQSAHAAGAAGVAVMAVAVWLAGGLSGGIPPAVAVALAGGLWADWTRVMGFRAFEMRLRLLLEDVGLELWPKTPAQLLPPPRRV
jgi:hypothetical protein